MNKNEFDDKLNECLDHISIDFLPLHDIYRTLFGFNRSTPTEQEISQVLEMIKQLLEKNIVCLEGSQMKPTNKSVTEVLDFIKFKWETGKYEEINYGLWFDKQNLSCTVTTSS